MDVHFIFSRKYEEFEVIECLDEAIENGDRWVPILTTGNCNSITSSNLAQSCSWGKC